MPTRELMIPLGWIAQPFSSLTHLLAALGLLLLIAWSLPRYRDRPLERRALWVLLGGAGGMLVASGTYHALAPEHPLWMIFWHLDHASIWLGLAANLSSCTVLACPELAESNKKRVLWAVAIAGALLELCFLRQLPAFVSPLLYVGLGWLGLPLVLHMIRQDGFWRGAPLLFGGLLASVGGVIDSQQWPHLVPRVFEAHELMHSFTTTAQLCFLYTVWVSAREVACEDSSPLAPST